MVYDEKQYRENLNIFIVSIVIRFLLYFKIRTLTIKTTFFICNECLKTKDITTVTRTLEQFYYNMYLNYITCGKVIPYFWMPSYIERLIQVL